MYIIFNEPGVFKCIRINPTGWNGAVESFQLNIQDWMSRCWTSLRELSITNNKI